MNKDAILTFIKKNLLSLICAVVAILAVVAIFYPLGGMITTLQTNADSHAAPFNELSGLLTKARKLPMSDPNQADPGSLPIFPNPSVVSLGEDANTKWVTYSGEMLKNLAALNQTGHDLLVPDEFPNPQSDSTPFYFARLYKLVLSNDPTVTAVGNPAATPPVQPDPYLQPAHRLNLQNDVLNGGLPPTPEEIKAASVDLHVNVYEPQLITRDHVAINAAEVEQRFNEDVATLPLRMKAESAKKHKIYVEKGAFTLSPAIVQVDKPALVDMWYAQMQLWVQQDLAAAIKEENDPAKNILDAPVKRLLGMQIPPAPMYVFPPASATGGTGNGTLPATAKETDPIPSIYSVSVTGRYSNGMYDVVPFRLVVDVDSTKVNEFIETLSHQRLITITSQNLYALDAEVESEKGYLYGSGSTVRLELEGEALFLRSWTQKLMPDRVKEALGLMAPPPGQTPLPTTPMYGPMGGPMGGPPMGGPFGPPGGNGQYPPRQ